MRWVLGPLLALSWLLATGADTSAGEHPLGPEIWFIPNPTGTTDFQNMWTDDAPWQTAAKKVDVLGVVHWWLLGATDEQILSLANFAKRRNMKLDFEIEAVERFPSDNCGFIEGYTVPATYPAELAILKRLNIQMDYLTMDGPLYAGHYLTAAQGSCALSVPDLIGRIASNVSGIIAQYPNIQVVEIEPIPATTNFPDWRDTLGAFEAGLTQALGRPVRALHLDVNWGSPGWIQPLRDVRTFVHQRNMRLGWYYDGNPNSMSNADWIDRSVESFENIEGTMDVMPDNALFASWNAYPTSNMPETSPTTLTWLINRYFRQRTRIEVQFVGQGAQGILTDDTGKPMPNATINSYVPGVDFNLPLPATVISGVVPSNAVYGLMAVRLNAECLCAGENDVLFGTLAYQETQGGSLSFSYTFPPSVTDFAGAIVSQEWVGGIPVTRVIASPTQAFYPNSAQFPVTPGAQFTYTIPASTIGGEGWYGHIEMLFLGINQNALPFQIVVVPESGQRLMSTATTGADGHFALKAVPRIGPGSAPVTVVFPGDDTHRSVGWSPLR